MEGLRFVAELALSKNYMPLLFRNRLMSMFKSLLGSDHFSEHLPRPFSFFLKMDGELKDEKFVLNKPVSRLYMSFLDRSLGEVLAGKLLGVKDFSFEKGLLLSVSSIRRLPVKEIISQELVFKILSPCLIEGRDDRPILPSSPDFQEEFNSLHRRIFGLLGYQYSHVELRFDFWKKLVIKHTLSGFRRSSGKRLMYLTGFVGKFILRGDPQSLRLLYLKGWGNRTGEGFGFVEVEDVRS